MKEDWETAISFVLKMEGGETAELDPNDPGGLTKYGISQKAYPNLNIKDLTLEQAKDIYYKDYWLPCSCDELPTIYAISVFDTAVNQGVGKSKRLLQISLNMDEVDGVIGPKTIAASWKAPVSKMKKYLAVRLADYAKIMSDNPKLLCYAVNWSYRVLSLYELIISTKKETA